MVLIKKYILFTFLSKKIYNVATTLPLSCHLVGSRLGRQNRLLGGFVKSNTILFDVSANKADNGNNTTVTLSALYGYRATLAVFLCPTQIGEKV